MNVAQELSPFRVIWVPVTTAWRVFRLRIRISYSLSIWRVAANIWRVAANICRVAANIRRVATNIWRIAANIWSVARIYGG